MNSRSKRISVVIPAFNHAEFIDRAIESCQNQEEMDVEIIVIDDGSSDQTEEVVRSYKNVSYLYQDNAGAHNAINTGIKIASNDLIAVLNDDDYYLDFHLKNSFNAIKQYDLSLVMSNFNILSENPEHRLRGHIRKVKSIVSNVGLARSMYQINPVISSSSFVFRKTLVEKVNFRAFKICNDLDFIMQCLNLPGIYSGYLAEPSWMYRVHEKNTTNAIPSTFQQIETACVLILSFLEAEKRPDWSMLIIDHGIPSQLFIAIAQEIEEIYSQRDFVNIDWIHSYIVARSQISIY